MSLAIGSGMPKAEKESWRHKGTDKDGRTTPVDEIPEWKTHHRRIDCRPGTTADDNCKMDTISINPTQPGTQAIGGYSLNPII